MGVPQDHRFQYSNDLILDDFLGSHHFGNPDINMYIYIICIYIYVYIYILQIYTYQCPRIPVLECFCCASYSLSTFPA